MTDLPDSDPPLRDEVPPRVADAIEVLHARVLQLEQTVLELVLRGSPTNGAGRR